nr:hypothetical protein [Achromobacter ruhlandii]
MQSQSSGSINYWPGFVDAFSNLVLALVFVIVILAMSLGMFSGLMAKMAIQRALVEQRLDESKKAQAAGGTPLAAPEGGGRATPAEDPDLPDAADGGDAPAAPPAPQASPSPEQRASDAAAIPAEPAPGVDARPESGGVARVEREANLRQRDEAAASAVAQADALEHAMLRRENEDLRQELAALRKKQAAAAQGPAGEGSGHPKAADKFGPMMPQDDHSFRQRIEDELQRTLKEFEARRDSGASIDVVIYVPNYALTENKRTALFYLISIKDYLMKRKVAPGQIRMHMAPAPAGQKDMTVSMSVEP